MFRTKVWKMNQSLVAVVPKTITEAHDINEGDEIILELVARRPRGIKEKR